MQLCHRYFAVHSFKKNDRYSVALACVYLAAKIMEAPKALRDVVMTAEKYRYKQYAAKHPEEAKFWEDRVHQETVRDEVLDAERAVLYTIGFNLNVVLPYRFLFHYQKMQWVEKDVFTAAWIFINDSGHTQMCLVYNPEEIAVAAIYAALVCLRKELPAAATDGGKKSFCELFNVTAYRLQEMLDHLMAMYMVHAKSEAPMPGQGVPTDSKTSDATAAEALPTASDISIKPRAASMPQLQGTPGELPRVTVVHSSPAPIAAAAGRPGGGPVLATAVAVAAPVGRPISSSGAGEAVALQGFRQQQQVKQEVAVHHV